MNLNEVDELMARKINLAREVFDCSEELLKISYTEDPNGFEHFLEKKAQYIDNFSRVDIMLKNQLNAAKPEELEQLKERLEKSEQEIEALLHRISKLDQQNKEHLLAEMAETKQKLAHIQKGDQSRKAYTNQGRLSPYGAFMDSRK